MNTPQLISAFEVCPRQGIWAHKWEKTRLDGNELIQRGVRAGVMSGRPDFGECAGEEVYSLGNEPGLDTKHHDLHGEVVHLACIADAITTAIRKPQEGPWRVPEPVKLPGGSLWTSGAYLDPSGSHLRRIALVSNWSDDRHYSEARSWYSLGEVCAYKLPMQQATIVLGPTREGKRHSHWAKGLLHPSNKKLRFRKRNDVNEPFKATWIPVWREDHDEFTTMAWLQAMLEDGVLKDVCFNVDIPLPTKAGQDKIRDLAARKLDAMAAITTLPEMQLVGCEWPKPCMFRTPCHGGVDPSGRFGFTQITLSP